MNAETVLAVWKAWLTEHGRWVLLGWAHLFVGFAAGVAVLWDAHLRRSRRARMWGWGVLLTPFFGLVYLLFRPREKPLRSPFGEVTLVPVEGAPSRPFRLGVGLQLAGVVPGAGHLLLGRPLRAVGYGLLIGVALTLFAFQRADVHRKWEVPPQLLPESRRGETVTVNFRVPAWLGRVALIELGVLIPLVYFDALALAEPEVQKRARRRFAAKAYYRLRVERSPRDPEEFDVSSESLTVGSAEDCDLVVPDEGVRPHHATFYVHHGKGREWSLWVRCFGEGERVRVNGVETDESELRPNDRVEVGGSVFTFLPL